MSKKPADHLHKYKKVNLSRSNGGEYFVYQCTKPGCSHYIPTQLAFGKLCECYRCGDPMVITRLILSGLHGKPMLRPHCPSCTKTRKRDDVEAIAQFLDGDKT